MTTENIASENNDPLASKQQWVFDAINLTKDVFDQYKGQGVSVGIYDDGLQVNHPDLAANYDASKEVKINGTTYSPGVGTHGTAVASEIAAVADNGIGGVGIASQSSITGVNVMTGYTAGAGMVAAIKAMSSFDVTNNSWNWTGKYADPSSVAGSFGQQFQAALDYAVDNGRAGLGTIIVDSSGNDWLADKRDANTSEFAATRQTITVGAVADTGFVSNYTTRGADVLISGVSSGGSKAVAVDDVTGSGGFSNTDTYDYFSGTSAAAPEVTAVSALMLNANANLGWRDVQDILALSADHTGSAIGSAPSGGEAFGWTINGADDFNGGGMHFSNDYGFGKLDAQTAVREAEVWSLFAPAQTSANEATSTTSGTLNKTLTDNGTTSFTIAVTNNIDLEHADLTLKLTHPNINELRVELISPDGTDSIVLTPGAGAATAANALTWTFGSEAFRGELSAGNWTVKITDTKGGNVGSVASYKLDLFGGTADNNDVYHYTDEFTKMVGTDSSRAVLSDTNGGTDWIDASGVIKDVSLNLNAGTTSDIGGQALTIGTGTVIENAVTSDGNDTIIGNSAANILYGMRGNDTLEGGDGADTLNGGLGSDTASYAHSAVGVAVDLMQATQLGGDAQGDVLVSVENLTGSDYADTLRGDAGANVLMGGAGNDVLEGRGGADVIDGGAGFDIVSYEHASTGINVNNGVVTGAADTVGDTLVSIEGFRGTSFSDLFHGTAGADYFDGGDGSDVFYGSTGADTIIGGNGTDTIDYTTSTAGVLVNLTANTAVGGYAQGDVISGLENIFGSNYSDYLTGTSGANIMMAGAGNDMLDGQGGADFLNGGTGIDMVTFASLKSAITVDMALSGAQAGLQGATLLSVENLTGTAFADNIAGTDAANVIDAGAGNDTVNSRGGNDTVFGGSGNDTIIAGGRGTNTYDGGIGIDTLSFAGLTQQVSGNLLTGVAATAVGAGVIDDGSGLKAGVATFSFDTVKNFENLQGGDGNDVLTGDNNANVIDGGSGDNILRGNGGADTFRFSSLPASTQTISDFQHGVDKIMLVGTGAHAFADLSMSGSEVDFSDAGGGVVHLLLSNVLATDLTVSDFMFA